MHYVGAADVNIQELSRFSVEFYKGVLIARLLDSEIGRESFIYSSYKKIISNPIQELNLLHRETTNTQEIISIYNSIIDHVCLEIKDVLKTVDSKELMISIYSMSSYMTNGGITEKKIIESDYFNQDEKDILISVIINRDDRAAEFNSWCGFDKAVIQTLFYQLEINKANSHGKDHININILNQLYKYTSTLVTLISEREFVTSGFYPDPVVHVLENDIVINGEFRSQRDQLLKKAYDNQFKEELAQFDKEIIDKLDVGIFKQYGFKAKTLDNGFENKFTSNHLNQKKAIIVIIEHKKLVQLIRNEGRCSREEAENLIKYFKLSDNRVDKRYESVEKYDSRLFEHPLVIFDDKHYFLSYYLMKYSIFILKTKMVYDLMKLDVNKNAKIIKMEIKDKFEELVFNTISPYMTQSNINIKKLPGVVNGKKRVINLIYELDVVAVRGNKLFLFECKDITYKFTTGGIRTDIRKTLTFINKLHIKINEINQYKEEFALYFGVKFEVIIPILVFKHYNSTGDSDIDSRGVNILSFTELENWIKTYCES